MASGTYVSGKLGFLLLSGSAASPGNNLPLSTGIGTYLSMDKWGFNMEGAVIKVTNFLSAGFQEVIDGLFSADVDFSGQWNIAAMGGMTIGAKYYVAFGVAPMFVNGAAVYTVPPVGTAIFLVGTIQLSKISVKNDTAGNPEVAVSGTSSGPFIPFLV